MEIDCPLCSATNIVHEFAPSEIKCWRCKGTISLEWDDSIDKGMHVTNITAAPKGYKWKLVKE